MLYKWKQAVYNVWDGRTSLCRFIQVVQRINSSFLFIADSCFMVWMYHSSFHHSFCAVSSLGLLKCYKYLCTGFCVNINVLFCVNMSFLFRLWQMTTNLAAFTQHKLIVLQFYKPEVQHGSRCAMIKTGLVPCDCGLRSSFSSSQLRTIPIPWPVALLFPSQQQLLHSLSNYESLLLPPNFSDPAGKDSLFLRTPVIKLGPLDNLG